jgi:hypothetical protein
LGPGGTSKSQGQLDGCKILQNYIINKAIGIFPCPLLTRLPIAVQHFKKSNCFLKEINNSVPDKTDNILLPIYSHHIV